MDVIEVNIKVTKEALINLRSMCTHLSFNYHTTPPWALVQLLAIFLYVRFSESVNSAPYLLSG